MPELLEAVICFGVPFLALTLTGAFVFKARGYKERNSKSRFIPKRLYGLWCAHRLSVTFGLAFLSMLLVAGVLAYVAIALGISVRAFYIVCGCIVGLMAGTCIAQATGSK